MTIRQPDPESGNYPDTENRVPILEATLNYFPKFGSVASARHTQPQPTPPAWNVSEQQQIAFAELIAWLDERERLRTAVAWAPCFDGRPNDMQHQSKALVTATTKLDQMCRVLLVPVPSDEYFRALDDPEQE